MNIQTFKTDLKMMKTTNVYLTGSFWNNIPGLTYPGTNLIDGVWRENSGHRLIAIVKVGISSVRVTLTIAIRR